MAEHGDKQGMSGQEAQDEDAHRHPDAPLTATTPRERRWAFRILFISLICMGTGQTVIFAILPPLSRELGLADFQVGSIFMVSAIFWIVASPYWGRQSDHLGRKPVILMGLVAFAVSTVMFAALLEMAREAVLSMLLLYPLLICARTIYGMLGPGTMSGANAYVADRTDRAGRTEALAAMGAAFVLGTTAGPGLVWALSDFGLLAPLYGVAALGAMSALAIWILLPERTAPKPRLDMPMLRLWDPRIRDEVAIAVLLSSAHAIVVQTITFFLMDVLAYDPVTAAARGGLALVVAAVTTLITQLLVLPRLGWGPDRLMLVGAGICAVGFAILVLVPGFEAVLAGMAFKGVGFSLARSGAQGAASLNVTMHEQGASAGIMGATGGAGFIVAPLIGFPLYGLSPHAPYVLAVLLTAGVMVWLMAMGRGGTRHS